MYRSTQEETDLVRLLLIVPAPTANSVEAG